jgi:hypothetical protein
MRKFLLPAALLLSLSAFADSPQFSNLTQDDVDDISREFSANFSHTGVSAPETDGLWGIEVGVIGGKSKTPDLSDVIENSGGDGSDFENLYHGGAMARAHFPLDIFVEMTLLPEREISDVTVKNTTYEIGWNAGGFFNLPLDLAVGLNFANSEISFKQTQPVASNIELKSKTRILWVGVSKTFLFITPYAKLGKASSDSDVKATATIFDDPSVDKRDSQNDGGYLALGANLQFFFIKFGLEFSQIMDVKRTSGKFSIDF